MQVIHKTIAELLEEVTAQHPQRDAIIDLDKGVRYNFKGMSQEISWQAAGKAAVT